MNYSLWTILDFLMFYLKFELAVAILLNTIFISIVLTFYSYKTWGDIKF